MILTLSIKNPKETLGIGGSDTSNMSVFPLGKSAAVPLRANVRPGPVERTT